MPEHQAAVVLLTNSSAGRSLYRALFAELMRSLFGIIVPPLGVDASPGAAGDLSRFAGVYAWPDRKVEVKATGSELLVRSEDGEREAHPRDDRTFIVSGTDPDNPAVTFGSFDAAGRPRVLYDMLWGLPRVEG